jgi:TPR repeat protein
MFFERAAASGLAIAALKLGDTYDADFLQSRKLLGIQPEPAMAAKWYRKAQEMGEVRAHERLRVLQQQHKLANLED